MFKNHSNTRVFARKMARELKPAEIQNIGGGIGGSGTIVPQQSGETGGSGGGGGTGTGTGDVGPTQYCTHDGSGCQWDGDAGT